MALASTGVITVETAPKNDCHQLLYPQGVPSCLLPPQEAPQDQKLSLTQDPFKLLLCTGIQSVGDFACGFSEQSSYFLQPSGSPESKPH